MCVCMEVYPVGVCVCPEWVSLLPVYEGDPRVEEAGLDPLSPYIWEPLQ